MLSGSGEVCSVGFALLLSGTTYATTARHCRGTFADRSNSSITYGSNYQYSSDGGASLLSSRGAGNMFYGDWTTQAYKRVSGLRDVGLGDVVCTSGGNSGTHCSVKVVNTSYYWNDGYGWFYTIEAQQQQGGNIAVIQGDSGGPVYVGNADGTVAAVGMIQGWNGTAITGSACGSVHDLGSNICSQTVLFSSMRTIANSFGATLVTG